MSEPQLTPETRALLSRALRALCLTRDYVGADTLPALPGWEWFDAGREIAAAIAGDEWEEQFYLRIDGWKPGLWYRFKTFLRRVNHPGHGAG